MTKLEGYFATCIAAKKAQDAVWNAIRENLNLEKPTLRIGDRKIAFCYDEPADGESPYVIYITHSELTMIDACALRDWLNDILAEI